MGFKVDNAIIMVAGLSSRFAPISYEKPKALIAVKGEVLIERQIRQLQEVGIKEIILVVGYMKEKFAYLEKKMGVKIIENKEYLVRNNNSSIHAVKDYIKNTYICSADNYFAINPFESEVDEAYYSAIYTDGETNEWCLDIDDQDWITGVKIGGSQKWFMLGHVFWSEEFSKRFLEILEAEYDMEETKGKLWEAIYMEHLDTLNLKVRKYNSDFIYEFDSLDELREFDETYKNNSNSQIMQFIANKLECEESEIYNIIPEKDENGEVFGIRFMCKGSIYTYSYEGKKVRKRISAEDVKRVNEVVENVLGEKDILRMERMGGLTNRTYLVTLASGQYVVRMPGEGTEELINRRDEKVSTELACKIGIDTKLYLFDEKTGEKVTSYITNSRTMHQEELSEDANIVRVAELLYKLHKSGVNTEVPFDVIDMAESYEKFICENGGTLYDDYKEVKAYINEIKTSYLPGVVKVPCHNDPLCENWILQNDERMYLIDWEYAGMNDPMWDLADVSIEANYTHEMDDLLLKSYFGGSVSDEQWNAFLINKVLIDYLWSLWGKTRAVYDGEEMEQYALDRYVRMKENMKLMEG